MKQQNQEFIVKSKPDTCPNCESLRIARIIYGFTSKASLRKAKEKELVILGGCCPNENSPNYRCLDCNTEFILK